MSKILCIETSTNVCSVALTEKGKVLFSEEEFSANSHAAMLTVLIERIMKRAGIEINEIDAVAVSSGPGSYTGLRIGVSTAKGICYALDKPLIAVSSLYIIAQQALLMHNDILNNDNILLCPMIDARRMEVYTALFDKNLNNIEDISAKIINADSYSALLEKQKIAFFGNGSTKCKALISNDNAIFIDNIYPVASAMAMSVYKKFNDNHFEDTAYFEPFYLKDFIATTPKNIL
jgi:tRNA threonylcarbamoyladenosine biosynthesis protein TsaB